MSSSRINHRIKVGLFALFGVLIVTALIFYIGSNRKLIGKRITVYAVFKDVSGLKNGNAVRFSGVEVGSVKSIEIISDSSVKVQMLIDDKDIKFVKKDSKATISTEGLLGSKFIRLEAGSDNQAVVENGDELIAVEAANVDAMMSTITQSLNNAKDVTATIEDIVKKVDNGEGTLGALITDKKMLSDVKGIVSSFEGTGKKANELTGKMITVADSLQKVGTNAVTITNKAIDITKSLDTFTKKLNNDSSTLGKFISDTSMARQIDKTLVSVDKTIADLQQTSEKVRSSWFVRIFNKNKDKE